MESSDAAFHDFTRLEPSVEWGEARGGTAWRALYEDLSYGDAGLRSYGRAEFRMRRAGSDGPRRSETLLALSRKSFGDNDLQTYVQLRGRFGRTLTGLDRSPEVDDRALDQRQGRVQRSQPVDRHQRFR